MRKRKPIFTSAVAESENSRKHDSLESIGISPTQEDSIEEHLIIDEFPESYFSSVDQWEFLGGTWPVSLNEN